MKEQILKLKAEGFKPFEIATKLGCSPSTVTYHVNINYRNRHVANHRKRRQDIKLQAIVYKGGKCQVCDYDRCLEALDFHHRDPEQKDPNIRGALTRRSLTLEDLKPELDKCVLLCCRCHREVHSGLTVIN